MTPDKPSTVDRLDLEILRALEEIAAGDCSCDGDGEVDCYPCIAADALSREQPPAAIPVDVEAARGKDDNPDGMICT